MAGKLQMREFLIQGGGFLRGFNKIWANLRDPTKAYIVASIAIPSSRKCVHSSVYEKNVDEGVYLNGGPEDIFHPPSPKSWVPHPKTGVFGPAEEQSWAGGDHHNSHEKTAESVLEQQAWFRASEDVQKQPYN